MKWKVALACVFSLSVLCPMAKAAELKVLSVGTVGAVLREVIPIFERANLEIAFKLLWESSGDLGAIATRRIG